MEKLIFITFLLSNLFVEQLSHDQNEIMYTEAICKLWNAIQGTLRATVKDISFSSPQNE